MIEIWQAIVLGLVQGLTEFLPVSSSGHIAFFQRCFGMTDITLFFSIILHLGTLVAVCVVFWRDILALFKKPFKTLGFLVLATIPAAIVGLLLDDIIEDAILNGSYFGIILAALFLVTATVLFLTERFAKRRALELPLCFKTVIPMGLAQAVAILPGISRSGSTICAGTFAGGKSEEVAKFSFLMSIPVILGSFVVELYKGLRDNEIQQNFVEGGAVFGWSVALGFVISAIAGLFAIKIMLKAIKNANYKWFSLYLVLIAITSMVLQFTYFNK
ncbi:MAG: undecaprenyl-diphosphate phosphatase [Clostridia bacterium]|nr:undecaprenyl-diphosphate phosphatase [Clostridia bacterium]